MKEEFRPDSLTTVLLVKAFNKGDALTLSTPGPNTPIAANDVCVVKLLVGPGNPGRPVAINLAGHRHRSVAAGARKLEPPDSRCRRRWVGRR